MATRTMRFRGKAYSTSGNVSLVVNFNSVEVHNGTVTTTNSSIPLASAVGSDDLDTLFSFTVDTSVTGNIPLSIAVSGGTLFFDFLEANYSGYVLQETDGTPDIVDGSYVYTTAPSAYWNDVNSNDVNSDGKINIVWSGGDEESDRPVRTVVDADDALGDWIYQIDDGVTFSCDYVVDANKTFDSDVPPEAGTP